MATHQNVGINVDDFKHVQPRACLHLCMLACPSTRITFTLAHTRKLSLKHRKGIPITRKSRPTYTQKGKGSTGRGRAARPPTKGSPRAAPSRRRQRPPKRSIVSDRGGVPLAPPGRATMRPHTPAAGTPRTRKYSPAPICPRRTPSHPAGIGQLSYILAVPDDQPRRPAGPPPLRR